jgi:hypothetical protein
MNIRLGYRSDINEKVKEIVALCETLNLDFDNTTPNRYAIIDKNIRYEFSTYRDVITALHLYECKK